jgi:sortase A
VTPAPKDVTVPEALRRALPNDQSSAISHDSAARAANVMALLEIPRLRLSSAVVAGDDADVLDVAVGHLPDTPKPWDDGNSALAAHRDGLFRPLKHIKVGDEVRVRSEQGEFVYRVRETKVVTPDDLSVLAPTSTATLTLITCYPFNFIGAAPKRFIVHADRVESSLSPH